MRLPEFLVVGAMKAGTTAFCADLANQAPVFFPAAKEPHTLLLDDVESDSGRRRYARLFAAATPTQLCGEGSTGYSKLPTYPGIPERARALLGPELKVIYVVRDPVARALSHHYHLTRVDAAPPDFARALAANPELVDYGRYGMQLEPWIAALGRERVHVVVHEDYARDRGTAVEATLKFLTGRSHAAQSDDRPRNRGEEQVVPPRPLRRVITGVTRSQFYKAHVLPRTPTLLRRQIKRLLYVPGGERPAPPDRASLEALVAAFEPDLARFRELTGITPAWDLARWLTPAGSA